MLSIFFFKIMNRLEINNFFLQRYKYVVVVVVLIILNISF